MKRSEFHCSRVRSLCSVDFSFTVVQFTTEEKSALKITVLHNFMCGRMVTVLYARSMVAGLTASIHSHGQDVHKHMPVSLNSISWGSAARKLGSGIALCR